MIGSRCRSCTEVIVFLRTIHGARMPVEIGSCGPDDTEDTIFDPARHKSHFANCPGADERRKKRNRAGR